MQNSINSDLIRGHIDTIILSILYVNDRYGYEILGEIHEKSAGQYKIKQPTLYSCLKRLETQGFIYSYRGDETESGGGRRKYYALTEMGKELFRKNQLDWEYSRTVIDKLVSDKAYQFLPIQKVPVGEKVDPDINFETFSIPSVSEAPLETSDIGAFNEEESDEVEVELDKTTDLYVTEQINPKENIDEYFSDTESASYIDKVCGTNDNNIDNRSTFQIHNFTDEDDDTDESSVPKQFYDDEDEYETRIKHNNSLLNEALEKEYLEEQAGSATSETKPNAASDYQTDSTEDAENDNSALFKSYNVDISEVEEYDSSMSSTKQKPGKSLMDMLEEASLTRKKKEESSAVTTQSTKHKKNLQQYERDEDIVLNREYKGIIKQLLAGNENIFTESPAPVAFATNNSMTVAPTAVEPASSNETNKQWREQANFDKVSDSVRNLGDDIKIRTYNSETDKEYINMYYYYPNKLMLYQYGVLFILMLFEILVPFMIIKFGAGINSAADIPILIISCVLAAFFPIYAVIQNFSNPNKKKRYNLDFKNSMMFRLIVFALMLVIIYAFNVVFKMDVTSPSQYLISLIIPGLLATNVPISLFIFRAMYNTEKFNTD